LGIMRSMFLAASENGWLKERAPRLRFVRRTVSRFMPGEDLEDALAAAGDLKRQSIGTILTQLGENVTDAREAFAVRSHYLHVLERVREQGLDAEVSLKLTHLGLDVDSKLCFAHLASIIEAAGSENVVWIDMEASCYVDRTLELYRQARQKYANVGVCVQAYLYRTAADLAALIPLGPAIRLVKGAYDEPADRAFPKKRDMDENYFELAKQLISPQASQQGMRAAVATHDRKLIKRIISFAESSGVPDNAFEFQMLYGIQRAEQLRLAREGRRLRVLISYGDFWFPWFMRRLAERPANAAFVLRNLGAS
jgi:proline dehydrogenase